MALTSIVLMGHGAPATDTPPYLVFKLKQLSARRRALASPPSDEELEIEAKIRTWPRTADNDPYRAGLEAIAEGLRSLVSADVSVRVAYCEFCEPTLHAAVREAADSGAARVVVVPSMVTPGGVHSESDIPRMIAEIRAAMPSVDIAYAWPFDASDVATFFCRALSLHGVEPRSG